MARIPSVKAFTGTSVEVLNAIRNSASTSYRDFVPFAQPDSESVKKIGAIIMQYPALQNEFLNNLINRIGLVIVTNKLYSNPWRMFKKGILEMGESVEEIFVNIAKVSQFDPSVAEETVFQRQIPDVRATFHLMNYQKFYKDTISDDQLRQAFVSWDGVTDLIARIVNSMYTAAEYDEFLVMRYMLAMTFLNYNIEQISVPKASGVSDADYNRSLSTQIKALSNNFTFLSSKYNAAGVMTHTEKSKQYLITTVDFDANLDVESLAFAFNMDKIQFAGNRVLVPSFGFDDAEVARLDEIFKYDKNYNRNYIYNNPILEAIKCVLVSEDFFRVYDNLIKFTEIYNSEGLYWNYSLHTWKTFSVSPFENACAFYDMTAAEGGFGSLEVNHDQNNRFIYFINMNTTAQHGNFIPKDQFVTNVTFEWENGYTYNTGTIAYNQGKSATINLEEACMASGDDTLLPVAYSYKNPLTGETVRVEFE